MPAPPAPNAATPLTHSQAAGPRSTPSGRRWSSGSLNWGRFQRRRGRVRVRGRFGFKRHREFLSLTTAHVDWQRAHHHARRPDFQRVLAEAKHQGSIGLELRSRPSIRRCAHRLWRNRQRICIHEETAAIEQILVCLRCSRRAACARRATPPTRHRTRRHSREVRKEVMPIPRKVRALG